MVAVEGEGEEAFIMFMVDYCLLFSLLVYFVVIAIVSVCVSFVVCLCVFRFKFVRVMFM